MSPKTSDNDKFDEQLAGWEAKQKERNFKVLAWLFLGVLIASLACVLSIGIWNFLQSIQ